MPAANKLYYGSEKSQQIETCLTQEFPKYLEPQTKKKKKEKCVSSPNGCSEKHTQGNAALDRELNTTQVCCCSSPRSTLRRALVCPLTCC